jgi:low affinity Fe/Cu permease
MARQARGGKPETSPDGPDIGDRFRAAADTITRCVGTPWAMLAAAAIVVVWALTGPIFQFSDTWQLVINTGTTIVTFLMVFAIQTSQNREARALHLKLDELIRATPKARNALVDEEHATERRIHEDEERILQEVHRAASGVERRTARARTARPRTAPPASRRHEPEDPTGV